MTSALDVSVQAVVVELLAPLAARRHLAMLFITHNLALVRSIAQFAVVLRQGAVVEAGPGRAGTRATRRSRYTAQLMADVPRLAAPGPQREAGGAAATGAAAPSPAQPGGYVAAQNSAMSIRRMKATSSHPSAYSMKSRSAEARPGWPLQRECTPTDISLPPRPSLASSSR